MRRRLVAALALLVVAGCGSSGEPAKADPSYLFDRVAAADHAAAGQAEHLRDALPNQPWRSRTATGRTTTTLSDLVVIGDVVDVATGGSPHGPAVVTIEVETFAGEDPGADHLDFRFPVPDGADPARLRAALRGLGKTVVVLEEADGALVPVEDGLLLGTVSKHGRISFPALGEREAAFLDGTDTVAELIEQAALPRRTRTLAPR